MFDSLTGSKAPQNVTLLVVQFRRDDHRDRLAYGLALCISEHPLGSGVPRRDHTVESLGDDRVIRGLHDCRIPRPDLLRSCEVDGVHGHGIPFHTRLTLPRLAAETAVCSAHMRVSA